MSRDYTVALSPKMKLHALTVSESFKEFAGIDLVDKDVDLAKKGQERGILSINGAEDFETAYFKIMLERVEPALTRMGWVLLYDYPPSQAALARVDGGFAKRFEFYIKGVELSNGFYELCDANENRRRIQEVHKERALMGREVPEEDSMFYEALENGMPDCFGNALGFDRLLALILGVKNMDEVIPFRKDPPFNIYS
jgi:lysyl-tRNA synthetase class 2